MPTTVTKKTPTDSTRQRQHATKLALSVQYASIDDALPTRTQIRRWLKAALECDATLTVRFVDAEEGQQLNREFRGKDYPTNVLSFLYEAEPVQGDLVVCTPVVRRESRDQRKPDEAHFAHLIVHGALHLQGYDHQQTRAAQAMEARETAILAGLGYPDPYGEA